MDRGAWWAIVHGATESDMTEHAHRKSKKLVTMDNTLYDSIYMRCPE